MKAPLDGAFLPLHGKRRHPGAHASGGTKNRCHGPLDYSSWDADKPGYIGAIHAGLAGNYLPMRGWIEKAWNP